MAESRARTDLGGWIVALVLFIALLAVTLTLVPLLSCPSCQGNGRLGRYSTTFVGNGDWLNLRLVDPDFDRCPTCEGTGKLALLERIRPRPPFRTVNSGR